jgi:hypothetical protein
MMAKFKFKSLALAALLAVGGVAQATTVDLFTDPPDGQELYWFGSQGKGTFSYQAGSATTTSIIGGYRDLVLEIDSFGDSPIGKNASMAAGAGELSVSTGAAVIGTAKIQWDGDDSANVSGVNTQGLNHANLVHQDGCPAGGCSAFVTSVLENDQQYVFSIQIWDMDGHNSKLTAYIPDNFNMDVSKIDFAFAWWNGSDDKVCDNPADPTTCFSWSIDSNGTVNFEDIGAIEVAFNVGAEGIEKTTALDLRLGAFQKYGPPDDNPPPLPEPASIALVGLALLGVGATRRRKQQ